MKLSENRTANSLCDYCEKIPIYKRPKSGMGFCSNDCRTAYNFWSKINKDGAIHPIWGQCWEWTGSLLGKRYGYFKNNGVASSAHRFAYKYLIGTIPTDLNVLHKCDNMICVNPQHLFLGTNADNTRDMMEKNRDCTKNMERKSQKLSIEDVRNIKKRILEGDKNRKIAKDYGVSDHHICNIKKGRTWAWVLVYD